MKLVRITTKDNTGRFDGILNADLVLTPGSRIGLEQISLEIEPAEINIDTLNQIIQFTQGDTTYNGLIEQGLYSVNEGSTLLENATVAMNNTAIFLPDGATGSANIQGAEYRIQVNDKGRVSFEFRKGEIGELLETEWSPAPDVVASPLTPNVQTFWGVDATVNAGSAKPLFLKDYRIPNGNCYMEATIYNAAKNNAALRDSSLRSGVWLCFTDVDIRKNTVDEMTTILGTEAGRILLCQYGVGVDVQTNDGQVNYVSIHDGIAQPFTGSSTSPALTPGDITNPRIRLQRSGYSGFYAKYWDSSSSGMVQLNVDADKDKFNLDDMYSFVIFWDNKDHIQVSQLQSCMSAFATDPIAKEFAEETYDRTTGYGTSASVNTIYYPPLPNSPANNLYQGNVNKTENSLTIPASDLAGYLGFKRTSIPTSGTRLGINFNANASTRFRPRLTAETLILLSDTIPISSFDTTIIGNQGQGERRSILAVIPTKNEDGKVVYEPKLKFLNVDIATPISLRNLKFRLVDESYSPLSIFGDTSMVILISSPDEA